MSNWLNDISQDDLDPTETREWMESLKAVLDRDGPERAHYLLERMVEMTRRAGAMLPFQPTTEYVNTIPAAPRSRRCRATPRWNGASARSSAGTRWRWWCAPTASPANSAATSPSFASSATLYDVGFNHFWRAPTADHPGDLLYIQGHSSPGIYARAFLEGRISEDQLDHFRMEVDGKGISSYPHPWLMPDFWQTPTVSHGPGPDQRDLPGALLEVPRRPRPDAEVRSQGLVLPGRRRDRRARDRWARSRWPAAKASTT